MALRAFAAVACFGLPALGRERAQGVSCMSQQGDCSAPCRTPSEDGPCECDIGPNGIGGVAARWCEGESLYMAYYEGNTEAECIANISQYTKKVPTSFGWEIDSEGEVCRPDPEDPTMFYKLTCNGVEDHAPFVRKVYNNTECDEDGLIDTRSDMYGSPCQCFSNGWEAPRSECVSCDPSDYTCSDRSACQLAKATTWTNQGESMLVPMCKDSQGQPACQCKSKNYKTSVVCLGGRMAELTYMNTNYAECRDHPDRFTLKQYVTWDDGCHQGWMHGANSMKHVCTGVADYQPPKEKLYSDASCEIFERDEPGTVNDQCACIPEEMTPRSSCRTCDSQDECQYKGGCEMAELGDGSCAWNASAPAGKKCGCFSRNYHSTLCFGGQVNDVTFADVDYEKCDKRDVTQTVLKRPRDPTRDSYSMQCQQINEPQGAKSTIRNVCTGVADGGVPMQRYYTDTQCKEEDPSLAQASMWADACTCIGHVECAKGTKFEKFACDTAGDGIIATEYEDSECKRPTSITHKYPSPGDGVLGQCVDYPSRILHPKAESQFRFTCPGGNLTAEFWQKGDTCASTPDDEIDVWSECVCVGQLRYNDQLKRDFETVAGDVTLRVNDVEKALADEQFVDYIKQAVAQTAAVPPEAVTDLKLSSGGRRLSESSRRLQEGDVVATYKVVLPKAQAAAAKAALSEVTAAEINTILQEKPALSFTFEATIVGDVTSAPTSPSDSAATRDDPVPEASTTEANTTAQASTTEASTTAPKGGATVGDAFAHAPGLAAAMLVVAAAAA